MTLERIRNSIVIYFRLEWISSTIDGPRRCSETTRFNERRQIVNLGCVNRYEQQWNKSMLSDFDGIALTSDKVPFCMLNEGPMKDVETDDCNMKF